MVARVPAGLRDSAGTGIGRQRRLDAQAMAPLNPDLRPDIGRVFAR